MLATHIGSLPQYSDAETTLNSQLKANIDIVTDGQPHVTAFGHYFRPYFVNMDGKALDDSFHFLQQLSTSRIGKCEFTKKLTNRIDPEMAYVSRKFIEFWEQSHRKVHQSQLKFIFPSPTTFITNLTPHSFDRQFSGYSRRSELLIDIWRFILQPIVEFIVEQCTPEYVQVDAPALMTQDFGDDHNELIQLELSFLEEARAICQSKGVKLILLTWEPENFEDKISYVRGTALMKGILKDTRTLVDSIYINLRVHASLESQLKSRLKDVGEIIRKLRDNSGCLAIEPILGVVPARIGGLNEHLGTYCADVVNSLRIMGFLTDDQFSTDDKIHISTISGLSDISHLSYVSDILNGVAQIRNCAIKRINS